MAPLRCLITLFLALASVSVAAQFPTRPLRVVVPFPPGGSADAVARAVSQEAARVLGQPVVVENRPGAGGNVGAEAVAKSAADGYTLLFGIGSIITINPWLYKDMPFDALKDLAPLTFVSGGGFALVANARVSFDSLDGYLAHAKRNPGRLNYGSFGNGSASHLMMEMLKSSAGIFVTHIPYRGAAAALTDTIAGQLDVMFDSPINSLPHIRAGKLKVLAVSSAKRMAQLPQVPAVGETLRGYEAEGWQGMFAPRGLAGDISARLIADFGRAIRSAEVQKRLADNALESRNLEGAPFADFVAAEHAKWGKVVRATGARLD